tara:strand:+ start:394 stop:627 length:234 start_codon:yes stop_codon:yes gene_type:complete
MNTTQQKVMALIKTPEFLWEFDLLWDEYNLTFEVAVTLEMFKLDLDCLVIKGDLEKVADQGSLFYAMPRRRLFKLRS